jgi:hypothetical protein
MSASDVLFQLSPSAVFRVIGPREVEAVVDGERHVLLMEHYRIALEFSSARAVGEVRAALAGDVHEDVEALVDTLTRHGILSTERIEASDAPLQTILNAEIFRDPRLLPTIGREIENGRAVVIAQAFEPDLARRVHAALEQSTSWKPYEGHTPFFQFRHHNHYGWSNLPPEVRECARVLDGMPAKLLLSVFTGADCRGPLSIGASMYLPGDYSLPHNDVIGTRSVAYIWYLTKDWSPEWGGQFVPNGRDREPILQHADRVQGHRRARLASRVWVRLSVNGWWTGVAKASGESAEARDQWPVPLVPGRYGARTSALDGRNDVVLL